MVIAGVQGGTYYKAKINDAYVYKGRFSFFVISVMVLYCIYLFIYLYIYLFSF